MKVIILAGGRGTRLAEETSIRPKPMVEIGGEPILWHIMRIYASHGYKDFLVACGEFASEVKAAAIWAGLPDHRAAACSHAGAAAAILAKWLEPGDVLLVKGSRMMAMERIVKNLRTAMAATAADAAHAIAPPHFAGARKETIRPSH